MPFGQRRRDEESAVPSDPDVVIEADHVTMCFLLERDAPLSLKERVVRTLRHERRQDGSRRCAR